MSHRNLLAQLSKAARTLSILDEVVNPIILENGITRSKSHLNMENSQGKIHSHPNIIPKIPDMKFIQEKELFGKPHHAEQSVTTKTENDEEITTSATQDTNSSPIAENNSELHTRVNNGSYIEEIVDQMNRSEGVNGNALGFKMPQFFNICKSLKNFFYGLLIGFFVIIIVIRAI